MQVLPNDTVYPSKACALHASDLKTELFNIEWQAMGANHFGPDRQETGEQKAERLVVGELRRLRWSEDAGRILNAKNEAAGMGSVNMQIARAYIVASDPLMPTRTWRDVIRSIISEKTNDTRERWETLEKDKAIASLWKLRVVQTRADQLMKVLKEGTVSTNVFLRRMHNHAMGMSWLAWPILPKKRWTKVVYGEKRGITLEEHQRIIARETNPERRDYYELLWCLGGSQSDVASLHAEDIDWKDRTVFYRRKKNAKDALQHFGDKTQPSWRGGRSRDRSFRV